MPKFALRYPFFIIMLCLMVALVGVVNIARMPVDLFPKIDMPVVVVATFYNGMPPEQIEADITNTFERFFTLGANIDHSESRSLTGVSLIKIYFKPGTDPNAALSNIANLAMADLRRLPPGTLPPVVLGMDASTQPVCLVTLKGAGTERDQPEGSGAISGAQPDFERPGRFGPATLRRHLPPDSGLRGPVEDGGAQPQPERCRGVGQQFEPDSAGRRCAHRLEGLQHLRQQPVSRRELDERDAAQVGGQRIGPGGRHRQGGGLRALCNTTSCASTGSAPSTCRSSSKAATSNTITIVDGMKAAIKHLVDIPASLKTAVVFDQSVFVKTAIRNVSREAVIGLVLTGVMILIFLGSPRATIAVLISVPLSMVVCLLISNYMGGSINTMILGGLALVFSRLIDNGVIVLENIFRHMEMGESPDVAAEKGGTEVSMAVLAATFTTSIVFFPVTFFNGISKYIFTPLALGVVLSIFASYFFAMTVVPLFCAKFIRLKDDGEFGTEARYALLRSIRQDVQRKVSDDAELVRRSCQAGDAAAGPHRGSDSGWRGSGARGDLSLPWPCVLSPHRSRTIRHRRAHAQRHAAGGQQRLHRKGRDIIRSVVPPKTWT